MVRRLEQAGRRGPQASGAVGVARGEHETQIRRRPGEQRGLVRSRGLHDGPHVVHPLLDGGGLARPEARPTIASALVERDHTAERHQRATARSSGSFRVDGVRQARDVDQVHGPSPVTR